MHILNFKKATDRSGKELQRFPKAQQLGWSTEELLMRHIMYRKVFADNYYFFVSASRTAPDIANYLAFGEFQTEKL